MQYTPRGRLTGTEQPEDPEMPGDDDRPENHHPVVTAPVDPQHYLSPHLVEEHVHLVQTEV